MFISFEGIEGVGKSTNIDFLAQELTKKNINTLITREPGGTVLGEKLRKLLLEKEPEVIVPYAELLLLFASRAQHMEIILKALKAGTWVLCDRFVDASYAYQGGGRNLPIEDIAILEKMIVKNSQPNYTIILDACPEKGLERARELGKPDRFENEKIEFFTKVRRVYLQRASQNKDRYYIIDAMQPLSKVQMEIKKIIDTICNERK